MLYMDGGRQMKKNEVERLCLVPEDQLLNVQEELLEALAAYNLMVLGVDLSDSDPWYTEQEIKERYANFQKIIKSEENYMFMLAATEDEQWKARRIMAETERSAIEQYGTEYAEELHQLTKLINKA